MTGRAQPAAAYQRETWEQCAVVVPDTEAKPKSSGKKKKYPMLMAVVMV